jgi:hypothetical protein
LVRYGLTLVLVSEISVEEIQKFYFGQRYEKFGKINFLVEVSEILVPDQYIQCIITLKKKQANY